MSATWKAICCVLCLSGCSPLNLTSRRTVETQAQVDAEVNGFRSVRSLEDIDRRLEKLLHATDAQQQSKRLIQGWGQHGSWYDLAVVRFLWDGWPQKLESADKDFDPRRLFETTQTVLHSQPELACQVFWYFQWSTRVPDFAGMMRDLEPTFTHGCRNTEWDYYRLVLLYAGVASGLPLEFRAGENACRADWDRLQENFYEQKQLILGQRPFLRYDHEFGRWIVDREAKQANRYLTPEEQAASPRPTPLPNWDSEIIPPIPASTTKS